MTVGEKKIKKKAVNKVDSSFQKLKTEEKNAVEEKKGHENTKQIISPNLKGKRNSENKKKTSCHGWCNCLTVLKFISLIMIVPAFLNYAALQHEKGAIQLPGNFFEIEHGQKLYMHCEGSGIPTVIMEAPTGLSSDIWIPLQQQLSQLTTVCIYDRAGIGFSDVPTKLFSGENMKVSLGKPSTVERMVDDLHRLLTYINPQPKPYIMIGSEIGTLIIRFYAQLYESEVSDLILLNPLTETLFKVDEGIWQQFWYQHLIPSFEALHLAGIAGITRLGILTGLINPPISGDHLTDAIALRQKHLLCSPKNMATVVDEHYFLNESMDQLRTVWKVKQFSPDIGITLIRGEEFDKQLPDYLNKAWLKTHQNFLNNLHYGSRLITLSDADRYMMFQKPNEISRYIKDAIHSRRKNIQLFQK